MWTRQELKARGKAAFRRNYWKSVAAGVVAMLVTTAAFSSGSRIGGDFSEFEADLNAGFAQSVSSPAAYLVILFGVVGISMLISAAIHAFLNNPVQVGVDRFYLKNTQEPANLKELLYAFQSGNYLKIVAAKFLTGLFISLWGLLLVIPGIVKEFEYLMVGYLLADDPELGIMDALRKSKQMMKGHKWNAFVLSLSFLGWEFLSLLTFGILDVFYVRPYVEATYAELYLAVKQ